LDNPAESPAVKNGKRSTEPIRTKKFIYFFNALSNFSAIFLKKVTINQRQRYQLSEGASMNLTPEERFTDASHDLNKGARPARTEKALRTR